MKKTLLVKLLKLIVLKSEKVVMSFFLGINTRIYRLFTFGASWTQKNDFTIFVIALAIMFQQA